MVRLADEAARRRAAGSAARRGPASTRRSTSPDPKSPASTSATASPSARRVRGGRRADHAAADHEQVEPSRASASRRRARFRQSGFVHALPAARVDHLDTREGSRLGTVEARADDEVVRRRLEHVCAVAYPSRPAFTARATRPPGQERHRPRRRAAHHDLAVTGVHVVDHRAGAAVEPSGCAAPRARSPASAPARAPRPGVAGVEAGVMAVVGYERRTGPAGLEQLVPVDRRERRARPRARSPR